MARRKTTFIYNRVLKKADYKEFGIKQRKQWEVAMALKTLRELGAASPDALLLGVGAGRERTTFELANERDCRQVLATDIYNNPGAWAGWHGREFIETPAKFAPDGVEYDLGRILVRDADMCELPFPDGVFDGVFSSGSIEHVGTEGQPDYAAIACAASEIGRVVKTGGIISLSTEWKLSGDGWGWAHVRLFDEELLMKHIVEPSGCELVDKPDWSFDASDETPVNLSSIVKGAKMPEYEYHLQEHQFTFTSVHLALRKV